MSRHQEVPVLVVGCGAAGSMLSLELARHDVAVRTIDRLPGPSTYSRAITVHARSLEMFERIDPVLLRRFLDRGIRSKGYVLHFVDAEGRRSEVRPGMDFTRLDSRYPFLLVHRQDETENLIRDYTAEEYGRNPEWNTQCVDVRQLDGVVEATLEHANGERETVRCQYLVACDGVNSRVRRTLGLSQQGSDYSGTMLQNLDVFMPGFPDDDDYIHYCVGPGHFVMVARLPGGFYRLLMSQRGDAVDTTAAPQQEFGAILDKHFDGIRFGDTVWHSRWQSQVRLADTYRSGNIFLAGDSAHVHSTAGGQGMNCCLQDAFNLGWKLGLVLRGKARPELLDSYATERRPIGEQVIAAASSLHSLFMAGNQPAAPAPSGQQGDGSLQDIVAQVAGLSYTYRTTVASPDGTPATGDRAPDADLPQGGSLYDLTRHTGFTLIAVAPASRSAQTDTLLQSIAARFGGLLHTHQLAPGPARYVGQSQEPLLYLLRPDGYVGYRAPLSRMRELELWLAQQLMD